MNVIEYLPSVAVVVVASGVVALSRNASTKTPAELPILKPLTCRPAPLIVIMAGTVDGTVQATAGGSRW